MMLDSAILQIREVLNSRSRPEEAVGSSLSIHSGTENLQLQDELQSPVEPEDMSALLSDLDCAIEKMRAKLAESTATEAPVVLAARSLLLLHSKPQQDQQHTW